MIWHHRLRPWSAALRPAGRELERRRAGQQQRRGPGAVLVHGFWNGDGLEPEFSSPYSGTNLYWTRLFAALDVDPATGLYYNNARWYNPSLGVFLTTDPRQTPTPIAMPGTIRSR